MIKGVIAVAVVAITSGLAATQGAVPVLAAEPGKCIVAPSGVFHGPIQNGPTNLDTILGHCTPGDDTIVFCYTHGDPVNDGKVTNDLWYLIDDPDGIGARGYISAAYY
ncbi:MAG: hypothetical protein ACREN8_09265, partial [Candidatus Dormibacteraceae bacterium]